mmetsp:Transcript_148927/g.414966  ORF Transcript_148927/g.414966 Transcript_148927/m.414966 type:complete len:767 (-) Transcript_148927:38-2338(-)
MANDDPQSGRIRERFQAKFINNTPEKWTMYVMHLEPKELQPGESWLTRPIGKPGALPAWFSAKCKCTSGSGSLKGRWMYNPLLGLGWSHELRYWAWRHGLEFGDGIPRKMSFYDGGFSIMEATVVLEELFRVGMKDTIVGQVMASLAFFSVSETETSVDTRSGEDWLSAALEDPALAEPLAALKMLFQMSQTACPKVQALLEKILLNHDVLDAAVGIFRGASADTAADETAALQTRAAMGAMAVMTGEVAQDAELQQLQFGIMGALAPLMMDGSRLARLFKGIIAQLPVRLLSPILKKLASAVDPDIADRPVDIPRIERLGRQVGNCLLATELEAMMPCRPALSAATKHHPVMVVFAAASLMCEHAMTVDDFMRLGTAIGFHKREASMGLPLGRARGIPPEIKAYIKAALDGQSGVAKPRITVPQMARNPPDWALTFMQFLEFIEICQTTAKWDELLAKKKFLTMYDMDHAFVRPVTRGLSCSLALFMNQAAPLRSKIMLSHAWGEDVEETAEALETFCQEHRVPLDTPVWFCVFSIYQPGSDPGDPGPTINDQVILVPSPFQQVIRSDEVKTEGEMVVLHTTTAEVYDRLWCVHEIDEALVQNVRVRAACSGRYSLVQTVIRFVSEHDVYEPGVVDPDFTVFTANAECGSENDTRRIRHEVESKDGGYERLDRVITAFRKEMLKDTIEGWRKMQATESMMAGIVRCLRRLENPSRPGTIRRRTLEIVLQRLGLSHDISMLVDRFADGTDIFFEPFLKAVFDDVEK